MKTTTCALAGMLLACIVIAVLRVTPSTGSNPAPLCTMDVTDSATLVTCPLPAEDMAEYEYHNGKAYFYVYHCSAADDPIKEGDC